MPDRRLVVNGADFGLTSGVNAGIADAHRAGILTSASVFANAPATDDAVRIARDAVARHQLSSRTVNADPVLPAELVPTLAPGGISVRHGVRSLQTRSEAGLRRSRSNGEMQVRHFHESSGHPPYSVLKVLPSTYFSVSADRTQS